MLYSIAQSYQVSFACWQEISSSTPPNLLVHFYVDNPEQASSFDRWKITVVYLAATLIFAIPIIQSIALNVLFNTLRQKVKTKIQEDSRINPDSIDKLTSEFLKDSSNRIFFNQETLLLAVECFLKSKIEPSHVLTDKQLLLDHCLEDEINGYDCCLFSYEPSWFPRLSKSEISKLSKELQKHYKIFFKWVQKHLSLSIDDLLKQTDIPQSPFTKLFLTHLNDIYANASLHIECQKKYPDFEDCLFPLLLEHLEIHSLGKSFNEGIEGFLNDLVSFYKEYKNCCPDTFSTKYFTNLYEEWKKYHANEPIKIFLSREKCREAQALDQMIWDHKDQLNELEIPVQVFHSKTVVQERIDLFQSEYKKVQSFLGQSHPATLNKIRQHFQSSLKCILLDQWKQLLLAPHKTYYRLQIENIIKENAPILLRTNPDYIECEIIRFENQLKEDQTVRDSVSKFLTDLKQRLEIELKIKEIKQHNKLSKYFSVLLEYRKELLRSEYPSEQLTHLTKIIHRELIFHLSRYGLNHIQEKELDSECKQIVSICKAVSKYIEQESDNPKDLKKKLQKTTPRKLPQQELSGLTYLALVTLLARHQFVKNKKALDQSPSRSSRSRSGRPLASKLLQKNDLDFISRKLEQVFSLSFLKKRSHTFQKEIEIFREYFSEP